MAAAQSSMSTSKEAIEAVVELPILYVDEHIVVVNKPFGLNTIPGNELVKEPPAPPSTETATAADADGASAAPAPPLPPAPAPAADAPAPAPADAPSAAPAAPTITSTSSSSSNNNNKRKRTHQEMWHDMLRGPTLLAEAAALPPDRGHLRPYLESLAARRDAVPRKRQKFVGWGQRTLKCDGATAEELYEVLHARFEAEEGGRTDSVMTRLLRRFKEVKTVHRLDCETSGACVLGLNVAAARELSAQFKAKVVEKRYVAVVEGGALPLPRGRIDLAIRPEYAIRPKQLIDPVGGKEARTLFRVVAVDAAQGRSKVALTPLTGRTHQLRLHMAALGTAIVGDSIYSGGDRWVEEKEEGGGGGLPSFVRPLEEGEEEGEEEEEGREPEQRPLAVVEGRLHLHAEVLSINHPATGERMTFVAEAPF